MSQLRWQEIATSLGYHAAESRALSEEWASIKSKCQHPKLPPRALGEQWMDTCPDCGFVSYCYEV